MSNRLLNLIKDYILWKLDIDEIKRVFSDNDVHLVPALIGMYNRTEDVYKECIHSLPTDPDKKYDKLIEVLNEVMWKVHNKKVNGISYNPNGHELIEKLILEMKNFGYEFTENKFIKSTVVIGNESVSEQIVRLKKELRSEIGKLSTLDIIGKSKELLESTFKMICDKAGVAYDKDEFVPLMNKAIKNLKLFIEDITELTKTVEYLTVLIKTPSVKINELRNIHGSGHGKNDGYKPVDKQTAIFISNIALSISDYLESRISKA